MNARYTITFAVNEEKYLEYKKIKESGAKLADILVEGMRVIKERQPISIVNPK